MAELDTPPTAAAEPPAPRTPPRPSPPAGRINRTAIGLNVVVQIVIVLVIVFFLNTISYRRFKRWDLSHNQNYALSEKTKSLLSHLDQPVHAIVFFPQAQVLTKDVSGLLREYEYASNKKFSVEYVDPYKNLTRARELSEKYKFGSSDNIVILDYKGKNKFVNAQDMAELDNSGAMMGQPPTMRAFKGEEAVTSALQGLTDERENKLYVVTGHGEPNLDRDPVTAFKEYVKRENINMTTLNLNNIDSVPNDATGLMIFGPKSDFTEREIALLQDFWQQRKGRLFVTLSPGGRTARLDTWLAEQGVKPQNDRVLRTGSGVFLEGGQLVTKTGLITSPMAVYAPAGKSITKELAGDNIQLFGATESLEADSARMQAQKLKFTVLLHSGEGFWGETEFNPGENRNVFFDPKKDHIGPLVLGLAIEKGALDDPRVKVDTARMIVVGNSGFLTDEGLRTSETGIDLALASLNWMFNRELVSGIPPKPKQALSLSLDDKMISNIFWVVVVVIPLVAGIFGLYVSWFRQNRSLLTLTVWVLGAGLFVVGFGWALDLFLTSRESGVSKVAAKDYLIPAVMILAPLAAFVMQVLKPQPVDSVPPAETV